MSILCYMFLFAALGLTIGSIKESKHASTDVQFEHGHTPEMHCKMKKDGIFEI